MYMNKKYDHMFFMCMEYENKSGTKIYQSFFKGFYFYVLMNILIGQLYFSLSS